MDIGLQDQVQLVLDELADTIKPSFELSFDQIKMFPKIWERLNAKTRRIFLTYPCSSMIFDFLKSVHDYNMSCALHNREDEIEFKQSNQVIDFLGYSFTCGVTEFVEKGNKNFPIIEYQKLINIENTNMRRIISSMWGDKYENLERNFTWVMILDAASIDYEELIDLFSFFDYRGLTGHEYLKQINPNYFGSEAIFDLNVEETKTRNNNKHIMRPYSSEGQRDNNNLNNTISQNSSYLDSSILKDNDVDRQVETYDTVDRRKPYKLPGDKVEDIYRDIEITIRTSLNRHNNYIERSYVKNFHAVISAVGVLFDENLKFSQYKYLMISDCFFMTSIDHVYMMMHNEALRESVIRKKVQEKLNNDISIKEQNELVIKTQRKSVNLNDYKINKGSVISLRLEKNL